MRRNAISRIGAMCLGLVIALLSIALADAAEISSGPLRVRDGDLATCMIANAGTANIANVGMKIQFRNADGTSNGFQNAACGTLTGGETCHLESSGFADDYSMYCEVTYPGGRIRATLCNVTLGLCSNLD
jgi:hypothetical protein